MNGIRDIKGPIQAYEAYEGALLVFLLMLLFFLSLFIFSYNRRRVKNREGMVRSFDSEAAGQALHGLIMNDCFNPATAEIYYHEASRIIRRFLENRLHIPAHSMTAEELIASVETSEAPSDNCKRLIRTFMLQCDMVQFAGYRPSLAAMEESHRTAHKIVDEAGGNP